MPFYKVLGGNWGEGYNVGDVIEIDDLAAEVRVEKGELIPNNFVEVVEEAKEVMDTESSKIKFPCCGSKGTRHKKTCISN